MADTGAVVNSHNEWSPLEEVIVGTPYHADYHVDTSFRIFFHENIVEPSNRGVFQQHQSYHVKPTNELKEECLEDLEGFVNILQDYGAVVRRPEVLTTVPTVKTPYWEAPACHALMSRDPFLIIGDEIIETSPQVRSRFFEGDLYKRLFTEYFKAGAKWTVAPRSRLLENSFDYSYVLARGWTGDVPEDLYYEIMFDGAQVLRLGRDLVFNVATENHRMGAQWLARHLGEDYRIHTVQVSDNHIDGMIIALRPGLLLVKDVVDLDQLPEPLRKWDVIRYERYDELVEVKQDGIPFLASQTIGLNILSLDESHVVVQDIQKPLMRSLENHGITPIPCRWRHGRSLGGGFHCLTLDVRRRGGLESYLD